MYNVTMAGDFCWIGLTAVNTALKVKKCINLKLLFGREWVIKYSCSISLVHELTWPV